MSAAVADPCTLCHAAHDDGEPCPPVRVPRMPSEAFEARYESRCQPCGDGIEQGDLIVLDEHNRAVHDRCAE